MAKQKKIPKRSEVEKQYTWAIEDIFATDALWEEALAEAKSMPEKLASFKGRLGESADTLYEYLTYSDQVQLKAGRLINYAMRKSDEDTANSFYNEMKGKVMSFVVALSSADSFSTPEIIAIPDEKLEECMRKKTEMEVY